MIKNRLYSTPKEQKEIRDLKKKYDFEKYAAPKKKESKTKESVKA